MIVEGKRQRRGAQVDRVTARRSVASPLAQGDEDPEPIPAVEVFQRDRRFTAVRGDNSLQRHGDIGGPLVAAVDRKPEEFPLLNNDIAAAGNPLDPH